MNSERDPVALLDAPAESRDLATVHPHPMPAFDPDRRWPLWARAIGWILVLGIAAGCAYVWRDRIHHWMAGDSQHADAGSLYWCGMHPQVIQKHPGICPICHMKLEPIDSRKLETLDKGVLIDPVVVQNMGVRVAEAREGDLQISARVVGYLREPESKQRDINLRVSGWVEKLYANTEGMAVHKGQPLFELYSPELQVAIEELISARRSREKLGPTADELSRRTADVLFAAAQRKLELWGLGDQVAALAALETAPATIAFPSPIDGHVMQKSIVDGAAVKAGDLVMRLSDRSSLWLDAQVFERDLHLIREGQPATVSVASLPGTTFNAEVSFVHPHMDPMTRTALVRLVLPNATGELRQGMYATVQVHGPAAAKSVLVPREAIIDTGSRQIIFVSVGDGYFEPREVSVGLSGDKGLVQILKGIEPGEAVVTSGQFLLDSESRLKEAIQKQLREMLLEKGPSGTATAHAGHPTSASTLPPTSPGSAPAAPTGGGSTLDQLVRQYLSIAEHLGQKETSPEAMDVSGLLRAAEAHAGAEAIAAAARAMAGKSLKEQRQAFKAVSDAMITLVEKTAPSREVAARLYVMHCPMAPGNWLQAVEQLANPYYAKAMKTCGEVLKTIDAAGGRP